MELATNITHTLMLLVWYITNSNFTSGNSYFITVIPNRQGSVAKREDQDSKEKEDLTATTITVTTFNYGNKGEFCV